MKFGVANLAACALLGMAVVSFAQEPGSGAVDITAAEMEIIETDKRAVFRGNVVAKRPNDTIQCEEMLVNYVDVKQADGSSNTEVDKIDCKSAVTITTATQKITGNLAVFFLRRDELEVTGNVRVVQGKTVLKGPKLVVDLKSKRTKMVGGVRGTFVPK
jgi:lipopolysaccharide export system protein LptA